MVATELIQTFLVNGSIMLMFIFFGIKLLLQKRNRLSVTISGLFLIAALGLGMNIIYRIFNDQTFNIIGNKLTIIIISFSLIFLFSFTEIIKKSSFQYTVNKQMMFSSIYAICLCVLLIIPEGVTWDYSTSTYGVPVWSWAFSIYGLLCSQTIIFLIVRNGIVTYRSMEERTSIYVKKYQFSLIGLILLDLVIIGNYVFNALNTAAGRIILLGLSACIFPAAILLYLGFRQEKK